MARIAKPAEAEEMRKRLMRAAYSLIAEYSFELVTLDKVAEQVGVSKGLVLYYFKTKERLLISVMERTDAIIRARAEKAIRDAAPKGPRAQFEAYLRALTLDDKRHRDFFRVYLEYFSVALRNEKVRESTQRFLTGCLLLEREVITRGRDEGVFRRDLDPAQASSTIHALIDGLSLQWLFSDEPFERFRERLFAVIFQSLNA